jgi:hypothetical protein
MWKKATPAVFPSLMNWWNSVRSLVGEGKRLARRDLASRACPRHWTLMSGCRKVKLRANTVVKIAALGCCVEQHESHEKTTFTSTPLASRIASFD